MSNLGEKWSNSIPLNHIVLIPYFVLLSEEKSSFDRKKILEVISRKNRDPTKECTNAL